VNVADVALLITAIAVLIGSVSAPFLALRLKHLDIKVAQIDHAVNGKPVGAQTMQSQIGEIHHRDFPTEPNGDAVLPLLRQILANQEPNKKGA
jgi:hypothetical protein